jgi:nicotinate phosphoribosyltransferase
MGVSLATDLYEITMVAGYWSAGLMPQATFELYVRELPLNRSYLIAAGLEQALDFLETLRFSNEDIEHLRTVPALQGVRRDFFDEYLPGFRFTGDVWAVEEGTPLFPPAPLLRVTAPLPEAQLVETALLAHVGFQTSVASRTARMVYAASGRAVVEFGARRAHGVEAGIFAARAAYLGGCASTSNVEAGRRFGIPVSGTMAHSWVMSFSDELDAFRRYSEVFGEDSVLLLDTYDPLEAAGVIVAAGLHPRAVRLDSGDHVSLGRRVRAILDEGGLHDTEMFVSGDLDEWRIDEIVRTGAPVNGFGVGAALSTINDAPSLGAIYKLVEIDRNGATTPVMKRSAGKHTLPGCKQVWRVFSNDLAIEDVIEHVEETPDVATASPLLRRVMSGGRRETASPLLSDLRRQSIAALAALPESVRRIHQPDRYRVRIGGALRASVEQLSGGIEGRES